MGSVTWENAWIIPETSESDNGVVEALKRKVASAVQEYIDAEIRALYGMAREMVNLFNHATLTAGDFMSLTKNIHITKTWWMYRRRYSRHAPARRTHNGNRRAR